MSFHQCTEMFVLRSAQLLIWMNFPPYTIIPHCTAIRHFTVGSCLPLLLTVSVSLTMPRPKGQCKFNLAWLTLNKYKDWVDHDSSGDVHLAYCKVCVKTITIGAAGKHNLVVLSRYPISRCHTYRDTWVTMRYVSRYLSIGLTSAYICNWSIMTIECQC